tara:strand:+ start:10399 stop:11325 length:927 start_codon:yes stop_codon:yes gene_type:complete
MAIVKAAKTLVGKAINIAKKKKKELEKTKTVKKVKKEIKKVLKNPKVNKAVEKTKTGAKIAGAAAGGLVGAGLGVTTGMGAVAGGVAGGTVGKAIRAGKKVIDKARGKKVKIDPKDKRQPNPFDSGKGSPAMLSENEVMDSLKGALAGGAIGLGAGLTGVGMMAASLVKSNTSPEQAYETSRLPDGRFSTKFSDANKNVVFSRKQLTSKEIDDVRTKLAIMDSILESTDPRTRRNEFLNTAMYLGKTYGISNVSGKQLSLLMPTEVYDGKTVRYTKKRTGISKFLLGDPSTNKNIQAAQRYYDKNIKG